MLRESRAADSKSLGDRVDTVLAIKPLIDVIQEVSNRQASQSIVSWSLENRVRQHQHATACQPDHRRPARRAVRLDSAGVSPRSGSANGMVRLDVPAAHSLGCAQT